MTSHRHNTIETNVNSHHFGFGALDLDKVIKTPGDCELTGCMPSNKFKEQIMVKQRKVEVSTKFHFSNGYLAGTYDGESHQKTLQ